MIFNFITSFVDYLNKEGFQISNDKISVFFEMFNDSGIDFSDIDSVIALMKIVFCRSLAESTVLPELFHKFKKEFKSMSSLKKKQEELQNVIDSAKSQIESENKKYDEKLRELQETQPIEKNPLTAKSKKFIKDNQNKLDDLNLTEKEKAFLADLNEKEFANKANMTEAEMKSFKQKITKQSEQALSKGDLEQFMFLKNLFDILSKMEKPLTQMNKGIEDKLRELAEKQKAKLAKIKSATQKAKEEQTKIQRQLSETLSSNILKTASRNNREMFLNPHNSVKTSNELPKSFDKQFKSLSKEEKNAIYDYIKRNLVKFKTRMNRNINTLNKSQINMQETIQNTCKTGGLPIQLSFKKPIRSKSNLVLILDVSGSCKEASEMMLTFMYMLKDLFPRGCKTFAFVNTLYDISEIMESDDLENSIQNVLNTIPTKGIYSNYFRPLQSLWEDYKKTITKDSLVIFIGDARNNSNPDGLEYLKNISRRAKSCYWLNTETSEKWGVNDSLAIEYSQFAKMSETVTAADIISVINEIK